MRCKRKSELVKLAVKLNYPAFWEIFPGRTVRAHFLALVYALFTDQMNEATTWTVTSSAAKKNCGHEDVIQWSLVADGTLVSALARASMLKINGKWV